MVKNPGLIPNEPLEDPPGPPLKVPLSTAEYHRYVNYTLNNVIFCRIPAKLMPLIDQIIAGHRKDKRSVYIMTTKQRRKPSRNAIMVQALEEYLARTCGPDFREVVAKAKQD